MCKTYEFQLLDVYINNLIDNLILIFKIALSENHSLVTNEKQIFTLDTFSYKCFSTSIYLFLKGLSNR